MIAYVAGSPIVATPYGIENIHQPLKVSNGIFIDSQDSQPQLPLMVLTDQLTAKLLLQLSLRPLNTMPIHTTHTNTQSTMLSPETTKLNQKAATEMSLLVNIPWLKLMEPDVLLTTQPTPSTDSTPSSTRKPPSLKLLLQSLRLLLPQHTPLQPMQLTLTHQSVSREKGSWSSKFPYFPSKISRCCSPNCLWGLWPSIRSLPRTNWFAQKNEWTLERIINKFLVISAAVAHPVASHYYG